MSTTTREIVELVIDALDSDLEPIDISDDRPYRETMHDSLHIDISKAATELGWKPQVPVADGVKRLVAWFLEQESASSGAKT